MQKKQTILVVASLLVVVLSVTLAYFTAQIIGKGKDVSVSSADLKITFTDSDGNIEGNGITPGWSNSKTFTVKNESNGTYKYDIIIKDLVNTLTYYSYLPKSSTKEDVALAYEVSIDKGKTHTYTIEIKYVNDEYADQSIDMGQSLSGTIYIREFTKPTMKLTDKLMADNPTIGTRTTFTAFTDTNTGTLYKATEAQEYDIDVYYFAGDAKNNWVKFGKTTESSCTYKGKKVNVADQFFRYPENEAECTFTNICDTGENFGYVVGVTESECSEAGFTWITENATWNGITTKDIYWRIISTIISTNTDGKIRLLYSGTSPDTTTGYIGTSAFNIPTNDPMYVGYKYGTTGSLENNRLNTKDSTIKAFIDSWYQSNLSDYGYGRYIDSYPVYCNDRNLASGETYSKTSNFDYASWERINTNKQPTYACTNSSDAFSVHYKSADLDDPIGLMTIDELSYAGGQSATNLTAPYVWYYTNANGESITGSLSSWSLSPSCWDGSNSYVWSWGGSDNPGYLSSNRVDRSLAVRPVISLSSCNLISRGDGSPENPYEIYTGSGACNPL